MFKDPKQALAMLYAVRQNCLGNDVRASNANIGVVKSVLLRTPGLGSFDF